jgi:hypothetical protein
MRFGHEGRMRLPIRPMVHRVFDATQQGTLADSAKRRSGERSTQDPLRNNLPISARGTGEMGKVFLSGCLAHFSGLHGLVPGHGRAHGLFHVGAERDSAQKRPISSKIQRPRR